ncbi:MAG TPA: hypothetical protein VMV17_02200, partial [Streptosporangiaceae bacterium]|nr:hypothetical protein [Streptosporangiaceae bacterium]
PALSSRQARPRPRWQHVVIVPGCAAGFSLAAHHSQGWLANVAGVSSMWSSATGVAMLGRCRVVAREAGL